MSTVAAIQMCSSTAVDDNLATVSAQIQQAAEQGAQLVVLPEMFAMMAAEDGQQLSVAEVEGEGKIQDTLAKLAKAHRVWIVAGTIPIQCAIAGKIKAACLVYDDEGCCVHRYDKIHLFDVALSSTESYHESQFVSAGNQVTVVDTPVGRVGLAICYDLRFPALFHRLCDLGAEIMVVPSAFTEKTGQAHWHLLTRCRAIDSFAYLIGANQGGTHAGGRKTYGHSLMVNPWGEVIATAGPSGDAVITADIDLNFLRKIRQEIPVQSHQRIQVDVSSL